MGMRCWGWTEMSKSRCHYNQPRQRWKRVSREDDVRLSRFGILRSHTFSLSPSFLPVSCSPRTRPPAASPRANRAVLSAFAVSKCQSNRERSPRRISSAFIMSRSKETCLFMSSHRICVCVLIRWVGARPRRVNNWRRDFSLEFRVPAGFHKLPRESSRLEADQLWLGAHESVLERYLWTAQKWCKARGSPMRPRCLPDIWDAKYLDWMAHSWAEQQPIRVQDTQRGE